MKKTLLLLTVLALCLSGCQWEREKPQTESPETSAVTTAATESVPTESTGSAEELLRGNYLQDRYIAEIDGAYAEEAKLPDSSTTAGMVQLSAKYADMWAAVADEYYQKLMAYDDVTDNSLGYTADDLHRYISTMKENWEQYYQVQCENYNDTLRVIYDRGTIVGPISGDYRYKLQKDWALFILEICEQLGVS